MQKQKTGLGPRAKCFLKNVDSHGEVRVSYNQLGEMAISKAVGEYLYSQALLAMSTMSGREFLLGEQRAEHANVFLENINMCLDGKKLADMYNYHAITISPDPAKITNRRDLHRFVTWIMSGKFAGRAQMAGICFVIERAPGSDRIHLHGVLRTTKARAHAKTLDGIRSAVATAGWVGGGSNLFNQVFITTWSDSGWLNYMSKEEESDEQWRLAWRVPTYYSSGYTPEEAIRDLERSGKVSKRLILSKRIGTIESITDVTETTDTTLVVSPAAPPTGAGGALPGAHALRDSSLQETHIENQIVVDDIVEFILDESDVA